MPPPSPPATPASMPARLIWPTISLLALLPILSLCASAGAGEAQDFVWDNGLRASLFQNRPIIEGEGVVALDAPARAADPATVPVDITAGFEQTRERYIERITLVIDNNPSPVAGRFRFTRQSGRADLAMRVRMNAFSPVRAIAELNDGTLHMSQRFVKASGGCSAPLATDLEQALSRLGRMKLKVRGLAPAASPLPTQLRISHPNVTGLQLDQTTNVYTPAHYVTAIDVSFAGQPVFSAQTDIAISADPAFGFYFKPPRPGELVATVTDNTGRTFVQKYAVDGRGGAPAD